MGIYNGYFPVIMMLQYMLGWILVSDDRHYIHYHHHDSHSNSDTTMIITIATMTMKKKMMKLQSGIESSISPYTITQPYARPPPPYMSPPHLAYN
jgi:hypothetical protein